MSSSSGLVAGILFVCLAATNVLLILEASRTTPNQRTRNLLVIGHRLGGYLFVILLSVMVCFMTQRLVGSGLGKKLPTYLVVHVALVLLLVPLVFLKVLIARRYKHHRSLLMPLGLAIFAISFFTGVDPRVFGLSSLGKPSDHECQVDGDCHRADVRFIVRLELSFTEGGIGCGDIDKAMYSAARSAVE